MRKLLSYIVIASVLVCRPAGSYGQKNGVPNNQPHGQRVTLSAITLNITTQNPSCGYNDGSISISPTGGTPPYIYSVDGEIQSNGYYPSLNADPLYSILVTDAIGQTATAQIILTNVPSPPAVTATTTTRPSTCTSADGTITLTATGGLPPYVYSIDKVNFSPNNVFTNLTRGQYFFFVRDANGCIAEVGSGFLPGQFDPITPCNLSCNGEGGTQACTNDGFLDIVAEGGTPPYLYSIDGINYSPGAYPGVSMDYNGLTSGLYHVYVKDATGAIAISAYQLIQSCSVTINYVTVDAACQQNNGTITVTAVNGVPPYSYTMDGINYQSSNVFSGLAAGTYSFSVKDLTGGIYSVTTHVFDACPTVSAVATDDTCAQNKGSIVAHGNKGTRPYQFSIDGVNFQTDSLFPNLGAGHYTITIKDLNGYTSTASATVVNNCLQISLTAVNATCGLNNGNINATASNGTTPYMYSIDGLHFQPGQLFDGLAAGSYTITAEDGAGLTATVTVPITNSPGPQISTGMTPASCSNTGGSISIIRTGGTAPFQYSIDNGATVQADSIFNGLDSAQYIAFAKDANGCTTSDTIRLTALPTPTLSLGPDTSLCAGDTLVLKAPQAMGYQYQWQDNSNGDTYTATAPGSFHVKVTNSFNCSASDTILVHFIPLPVFTLGDDTVLCEKQTLLLQPAVLPNDSYLWNTGSNATSLRINSAGLYWLQVTGTGCAKSDSIVVTYKPVPVIALGNDTILCEGQTLLLDATNVNSTYNWQDGSTRPTYTVSGSGNYSVKVTENGCVATDGIAVNYIGKPSPVLVKDTTVCITQQLLLDASYPQSSYLWQDNSTQPQYTVTKAGLYTVSVTNGCGTSIDTIAVSFDDCACKFYVPQAFTPNNDGRNDVFMPKYQCIFSSYELKVFNRWGQAIFESKNPSLGWDGTMGGQPQPPGTYVWEMSYKDVLTGKLIHANGTIILIR